jgi:hypothetical protein
MFPVVRGMQSYAIHSETVSTFAARSSCIRLSPSQGERIKVRGPRPPQCQFPEQTFTLPLSQTHTLPLTGASASVSPKRRERGEATFASGVFKILSA